MNKETLMVNEDVDGASLRDPDGHVFYRDGRVLRCMAGRHAGQWLDWFRTPEAERLFNGGLLIGTSVDEAIDDAAGGCRLVLSHERVEWITYVQEWSFSMLRAAALLHLELMEKLLPAGMILKDANPANVQWHGGRMRMIDVASVQAYRGGAWRAYGQFCRTMLFPLFACAYGGIPLNMLVKGAGRNGIDAIVASRLLPGIASFRSGVFTHVHLQRILQRFIDRFGMPELSEEQVSAVSSRSVLKMVHGLRVALERMPAPKPTSWTDYVKTSTYSAEAFERKRSVVKRWLASHISSEALVLDVGCNTGVYSHIAASRARQVIAIDADMACVDEIWRAATPNVLPLVVDFADATSPGGWALREQRAFKDRVRPDVALWLAVIHHLAIHNGIRLPDVCKEILKTSPLLVVEFVDPEDDMVKALLSERGIERLDYTRGKFLECLSSANAQVLDSEVLSPTRQLYMIKSSSADSRYQ